MRFTIKKHTSFLTINCEVCILKSIKLNRYPIATTYKRQMMGKFWNLFSMRISFRLQIPWFLNGFLTSSRKQAMLKDSYSLFSGLRGLSDFSSFLDKPSMIFWWSGSRLATNSIRG